MIEKYRLFKRSLTWALALAMALGCLTGVPAPAFSEELSPEETAAQAVLPEEAPETEPGTDAAAPATPEEPEAAPAEEPAAEPETEPVQEPEEIPAEPEPAAVQPEEETEEPEATEAETAPEPAAPEAELPAEAPEEEALPAVPAAQSGQKVLAAPATAPLTEKEAYAQAFSTRLYELCLGREPEEDGLSYWTAQIASGQTDGAAAAAGFVFSDEYLARKTGNKTFVTMLYRTMLGREPDEAGMEYWLECLRCRLSRKFVFSGFVSSDEYAAICSEYGIPQGSYASDSYYDGYPNVMLFVGRLYQTFLGRNPDIPGIRYWVKNLTRQTATGAEVIYGFATSNEFRAMGLTPAEAVEAFYTACLDRASDEAGKAYWTGILAQKKKYSFLAKGFSDSKEFRALCKKYGIEAGSLALNSKGEKQSPAQAQAAKLARKFIDQHSSASQSAYQRFRTCWQWLLSYMYYRPKSFDPADFEGEDWPYRYVISVLSGTPTGNCYGFACTTAAIAKELGFQPTVIVMTLDHAVVEIDGRYYDNMGGGLFGASQPYHKNYTVYKKAEY